MSKLTCYIFRCLWLESRTLVWGHYSHFSDVSSPLCPVWSGSTFHNVAVTQLSLPLQQQQFVTIHPHKSICSISTTTTRYFQCRKTTAKPCLFTIVSSRSRIWQWDIEEAKTTLEGGEKQVIILESTFFVCGCLQLCLGCETILTMQDMSTGWVKFSIGQ